MAKPWEQQAGETAKAFARFCGYLEIGLGRSLGELAHQQGVTLAAVKKLSRRWRWRDRVSAWDRELGKAQLEAIAGDADQARERQLREAATLQQLARAQLARFVERSPEGTAALRRELVPKEVIELWELGFLSEQELRAEMAVEAREHTASSGEAAADPPGTVGEPAEAEKAEKAPSLSPGEAMIDLLLGLRRGGVPAQAAMEIQSRLAGWLGLPTIDPAQLPRELHIDPEDDGHAV